MTVVTKLDKPLNVVSKGGHPVRIDAIDSRDHDCFIGEITTSNGVQRKRWDLGGLMRDGSESTNLPMETENLALLRQFAKHLGAN